MIILRQQSHQFERVKQVISHAISKERKYSFLVQWQDNRLSDSWEPQNNCGPIKSLIRAYFYKRNIKPQAKFRENDWDQSKKVLRTVSKSENVPTESLESIKLRQLQMGVSLLKKKQKQRIINFIHQLEESIRHGSPLQRRDHQVDYVQGVFKNKMGRTSFVVRTFHHAKYFVVSLKNMKEHFPKSLKRYFVDLLQLNNINKSQEAYLQQNQSQNEGKKDQVPTRSSYNYSLPDVAISEREDSCLGSIND